jgi:non-heme chloroperoxidase
MPLVTAGQENSTPIEIYYEDHGSGPPLVLLSNTILSIEGQGRRLHAALPDAHYVETEGGSHVMCVTHAEEVNRELLAFLGR